MEPEGVSCISEDLADNSREECLPQTAVAKISAHAAGKGHPRLTFVGSVADAQASSARPDAAVAPPMHHPTTPHR